MYKRRNNFVRRIRKGSSFHESIIAGHPLIDSQVQVKQKAKKIPVSKIILSELRGYASSINLECVDCGHSNVLKLDDLIEKFSGSVVDSQAKFPG